MDYVWRRFHINGDTSMKKYPIYTETEAKAAGIEYKHWREAGPGEYGLDDCGFVSICIRKKIWHSKGKGVKRGEIQYPFAKTRLFKEDKFGYGITKDPHWTEIDLTRKKVKMALEIYADKLMSTGTITEDDLLALGRLCRPKDPQHHSYIKRLLRHEGPKRFVMEKIKDVLSRNGVDKEFLIGKYLTVMEAAVGRGQLAVAKSVLDKFSDMLGVEDERNMVSGGTEHVLDWNKIMESDGDNLILADSGDSSSSSRPVKGPKKTAS